VGGPTSFRLRRLPKPLRSPFLFSWIRSKALAATIAGYAADFETSLQKGGADTR